MSPPRPATTAGSQAGFTVIEAMVACVLLLVGMGATLTIVEQAASTTTVTRSREQGTNLQRELVEAARSVPYDQLTPTGVGAAVRVRPALGNSSLGAAGWTIRRRNTTYTVSMGVCTVDDPRDGTGAHDEAGVFCAGEGAPPTPGECGALIDLQQSAAGFSAGLTVTQRAQLGRCGIDANLDGTVDDLVSASATACTAGSCSTPPDTNPADYKRIVSLVRWPGGYNLQTSQINSPGSAAAPAVTELIPLDLTAPYTISPTTPTPLRLKATTTGTPSTVALYRDGTAIGTLAPSGGASWTGDWNLGAVTAAGLQPSETETVDGSYQLSAKAFDRYGQYGATRSQTIVVNRRKHFAPAFFNAGRNGGVVEMEWSPARERDSKGFRVYRTSNNAPEPVEICALAVRTACRDLDPPAPALLPRYSVTGYDLDPSGAPPPRPGDRKEVSVDPALPAPGTPASLNASLVDGNVVLTWTSPAGSTTQSSTEDNVPDHYNIYRDGLAYGQRLDSAFVAQGGALTYTDRNTGGQLHDYQITAVNSQLRESAPLGPVRR